MLTDSQIRRHIKDGKIQITPFDDESIGSGNYQVHLGALILIPKEGQTIDFKDPDPKVEYAELSVNLDEGYLLKPKEFILGQTLERIAMDDDIGMFIDGRSTLARLGMSIHQSATTMLPGQDEHVVTLEIFNAGNFNIRIYPKMKIGKLIVFQSAEHNKVPYKQYGKYAGQHKTTAARFSEKAKA